jgi:hypothetical protein
MKPLEILLKRQINIESAIFMMNYNTYKISKDSYKLSVKNMGDLESEPYTIIQDYLVEVLNKLNLHLHPQIFWHQIYISKEFNKPLTEKYLPIISYKRVLFKICNLNRIIIYADSIESVQISHDLFIKSYFENILEGSTFPKDILNIIVQYLCYIF